MEEQNKNDNQTIHNHFEPGSNCQVFNAPISNAIFAMPGSHVTQVAGKVEDSKDMPSKEQLTRAVEATVKAGLWWGNTSWSVVFRVMQMMGYNGKVSQFVNYVAEWPLSKAFPYKCYDDAISKPLRKGTMIRDLDMWEQDGAQKKAVLLALALKKELEKD